MHNRIRRTCQQLSNKVEGYKKLHRCTRSKEQLAWSRVEEARGGAYAREQLGATK